MKDLDIVEECEKDLNIARAGQRLRVAQESVAECENMLAEKTQERDTLLREYLALKGIKASAPVTRTYQRMTTEDRRKALLGIRQFFTNNPYAAKASTIRAALEVDLTDTQWVKCIHELLASGEVVKTGTQGSTFYTAGKF